MHESNTLVFRIVLFAFVAYFLQALIASLLGFPI